MSCLQLCLMIHERPTYQAICEDASTSETSATLRWRNIYHWNILPISPPPLADVSLVLGLEAKSAPEENVRGQTPDPLLQSARRTLEGPGRNEKEFGCRQITLTLYEGEQKDFAREGLMLFPDRLRTRQGVQQAYHPLTGYS